MEGDEGRHARPAVIPDLVEVRVPTYRRPAMLTRALTSLVAQTYPHWRAVVLDDSPSGEGAAVVSRLEDPRIAYRPNPGNLGRAANLDRCFRREPFCEGSVFAHVLEDDNTLAPEFLEDNLRLMRRHQVRLLLRNQWIFFDDGTVRRDTEETCRGGFFTEGLIQPPELLPHLPFHCGISNGGLMWRLDCVSRLGIGPEIEDASHQEMLRTFQIREPLWYADTPLAFFRAEAGGFRPGRWLNLRAFRASQSIARRAVRQGPPDFWMRAQRLADRHTDAHQAALDRFALMALCWRRAYRTISRRQALAKLAKYSAVCALVPDPLRPYWSRRPA